MTDSRTDSRVTIALPSKGALAEPTLDFLKSCDLRVVQTNPRQYTATVPVAHLGSSALLGLDAEGSAPLAFYGWRGQHDLRPLSPQLAAPTA